jgi:double-strand break repair protein MRE11
MIQQANKASAEANPPPAAAAATARSTAATTQQQQQQQLPLPLIRLRVDYTGFGTINSQRLGQKYVGKVANPHDMLLWAKAAARRAREGQAAAEEAEAQAAGLGLTNSRPEQLDQVRS